jgi:hypothetical protein
VKNINLKSLKNAQCNEVSEENRTFHNRELRHLYSYCAEVVSVSLEEGRVVPPPPHRTSNKAIFSSGRSRGFGLV